MFSPLFKPAENRTVPSHVLTNPLSFFKTALRSGLRTFPDLCGRGASISVYFLGFYQIILHEIDNMTPSCKGFQVVWWPSRPIGTPESGKFRNLGIWNPVIGFRNPRRGIQNPRLSQLSFQGANLLLFCIRIK